MQCEVVQDFFVMLEGAGTSGGGCLGIEVGPVGLCKVFGELV